MRGIIHSIFDKVGAVAASVAPSELTRFFAALEKQQRGLARQTADFIFSGEGRSVLSTLGTSATRTAWQQQSRSYPRRTPAADLLKNESDAPLIRYGEVLAALEPTPANGNWGVFGTKASPDWLRHAFSTAAEHGDNRTVCSVSRLARVASTGNAPLLAVLDILFHTGPGVPYGIDTSVDRFADVAAWLRDNVSDAMAHQTGLDAAGRVELTHAIGRYGLADPYLSLLVEYGTSVAKTVRTAATKALTGASRDALRSALAGRWTDANPGIRTELVSLALNTLGTDGHSLLAKWRDHESDKRPLEALERALASLAASAALKPTIGPWERGYVAVDGSTITQPQPMPLPEPSRISEAAYAHLRRAIQAYNANLTALRAEHASEKNHWSRYNQLVSESDLSDFARWIESRKVLLPNHVRAGVPALFWINSYVKWDQSGIQAFFADPSVTLRHLIVAMRQNAYWSFFALLGGGFQHAPALELGRRLRSPSDIQVAADLWIESGGKSPVIEFLATSWQASLDNVDPGAIWPLVATSFDALDEALGMRPQQHQPALLAANALLLLETLPKVPHRYMLPLMTLATGTQKALRRQARLLLTDALGIDQAIIGLLGDSKQDVRASAADWLAARDTRDALPPLRKALAKEKSEIARAAIISAREKLGDDVSDCFNSATLLKEAETGLAKASTKGLEWFPFDLLPRVSWADGTPVDATILRWWVVLAHKLKQPGGNALFDLWLGRLARDDARRLSLFVLRSWIEQDTLRPSDDEGNAYAAANIDAALRQNQQYRRQYPQSADYFTVDRDKLFAMLKRSKTGQYFGSANDSKGVLALGTQAEGADAAAAVRSFLKDHGSRVSQDKALLDVLAANAAPAAIQIVLATANRFKARSVQEHAATLIEQISDRRGWTPEELADRTIPTAGLDERGVCDLDCGEDRTYQLVLDAQDALTLLNPAGKPTKTLPTARHETEKPLIAEAKKQLATARKELKQATTAQIERLYEAMCLGRRWSAQDWEQHLLRHPIVGRLLRRLVWIGLDSSGERVTLFRPLDDGSLSDVEDGEVVLQAIAQVQLAHVSLVKPDEAAAWRAHLTDYEIAAPFAQFDQGLPQLAETDRNKTEIDDRKGWMIETFKLRGTATRLGFVRGAAEDGGVFMTYERRFETAKMAALIEFTGSPLPEENIPAALQELRFVRLRRGGWHDAGIALKDVPPVLLAETWRTFHQIASAGTGFDPAWEKKAGW